MQCRDAFTFAQGVPITFFRNHNDTSDSTSALGNLNFVVEFWQPFIDVTKEFRVCGPLFSALIEVSRALRTR